METVTSLHFFYPHNEEMLIALEFFSPLYRQRCKRDIYFFTTELKHVAVAYGSFHDGCYGHFKNKVFLTFAVWENPAGFHRGNFEKATDK